MQRRSARKVAEQAQIMADQVNLYLDRARMAARIGVIGRVTEVRPVGRVHHSRAGAHLPRQAAHLLDSTARPAPRFQGERQDLEEMLGNLLDNASKWARSKSLAAATVPPPATGRQLARDPRRRRRPGP